VTPDGERFVTATHAGVVYYVDMAKGLALEKLDLDATRDWALALALSDDGERLVLGTSRGVLLVFDVVR